MLNKEQIEFDTEYITSNEVCKVAGVVRSTLMSARNSGKLPGGIRCNGGFIWKRAALAPHLAAFVQAHQRTTAVWDSRTNCPVNVKPA